MSVKSELATTYFPQGVAPPVSSALRRFTSVFGMGTGGPTAQQSPARRSAYHGLRTWRTWPGQQPPLRPLPE